MKEVKLEAGTDILDVFYMLTINKPSFANYNGFYIYAGCEEPPHHSIHDVEIVEP